MNPDPLSTNNKPMQYRDAVYVATILMVLMVATTFVPAHPYDTALSDFSRYVYDLLTFMLTSWITTFCTLTGLMAYVKSRESGEG